MSGFHLGASESGHRDLVHPSSEVPGLGAPRSGCSWFGIPGSSTLAVGHLQSGSSPIRSGPAVQLLGSDAAPIHGSEAGLGHSQGAQRPGGLPAPLQGGPGGTPDGQGRPPRAPAQRGRSAQPPLGAGGKAGRAPRPPQRRGGRGTVARGDTRVPLRHRGLGAAGALGRPARGPLGAGGPAEPSWGTKRARVFLSRGSGGSSADAEAAPVQPLQPPHRGPRLEPACGGTTVRAGGGRGGDWG